MSSRKNSPNRHILEKALWTWSQFINHILPKNNLGNLRILEIFGNIFLFFLKLKKYLERFFFLKFLI